MRALLVLALLAGVAHADTVTVGLFAPSAPFPSTTARVELVDKLGAVAGKALGGTGAGRVYARAGDFAAAVKKGEVTVALVDATYLAVAGGNFTVVGAAIRGGETNHGWQLVAKGGGTIATLKGKHLLVPNVGGREADFVLNVLLGGEVGRDYFSKIDAAPDTVSALAALGLGNADAAMVPAGVELPAGVTSVLTLPTLSGPLLVVYGTVAADKRAALASAITAFHGDATISGFRAGDAAAIRAIAGRFTIAVKRGPLAVPAVRLLVGDLVEGRTFAIERTAVTSFAVAPSTK